MGNSLYSSFQGLWMKEMNLLFVGIDNSGKSTLIHKLKWAKIVGTSPSLQPKQNTFKHNNINISAWDLGGFSSGSRPFRLQYYPHAQAVVFVVDSYDRERIQEAKQDLWKMLNENELRNRPFLIYASKQDLPNAMSVSEITEKLQLHNINDRSWHIEGGSVLSDKGIYKGLDWLTNEWTKQKNVQNNLTSSKVFAFCLFFFFIFLAFGAIFALRQ